MGNKSSKPAPLPSLPLHNNINKVETPHPTIVPWRSFRKLEKQCILELKEQIKKYKPPPNSEVSHAKILMIGQIAAGKSSFFNTINSIFSDEITHLCPSGNADSSFTTVLRQYRIQLKENKETLKFFLWDTCGIEEKEGPDLEDFKYLLKGNVPDGYQFDTSSPINPNIQGFKKHPRLEDQVHCVIFVFDGSAIDLMSPELWNKLKHIQAEVSQRGIPRVALLTKIDKLSKTVEDSVSKVFKSREVYDAVEKVAQILGIPRHNIHPIKNYEHEMYLNDDVSRLTLTALEQILAFSYDYLDAKSFSSASLSNIIPWRESPSHTSRETLLTLMEKIENYSPPSGLGIPLARIVMIGPIGAGKSSFVNTIDSIFSGRISKLCVSGTSQTSLTTVYRQYNITGHNTGEYLNFCLCDTIGIDDNMGPDLAELMFLIEGNVPKGYQFNPSAPIRQDIPGFIKQPGLEDMVHCAVFVLDATAVDLIEKNIWNKLNQLQTRLNNIGLPRAVLLTKIDQLSKHLSDDASTAFHNDHVHKAVRKVSEILGIQQNQIHPIKNYEKEMYLNDKISNLSLLALDQILGFASDFMSTKKQDITNNSYRTMFCMFAALVVLFAVAISFFKFM